MTRLSVSVIILSYNTRELTLNCLARFAADARRRNWQIIVVDNASSDGTARAIREHYPWVTLIRANANRGYAAGNNLGIRQATGEYICLLNSDIVVGADGLQSLCEYLRVHPDIGAVSAGLVTAEGKPQAFAYGGDPAPGYLFMRMVRRLLNLRPLHQWDVQQPIHVHWVSGACMCVRSAAVDQAGLLDERFFLYFEDCDWCLRLRQAGWHIVYNPLVSVIHFGGTSQPERQIANRHYYESLIYFYHKHYGPMWTLVIKALVRIFQRFSP